MGDEGHARQGGGRRPRGGRPGVALRGGALSFRAQNPDASFKELATFLYDRVAMLLRLIGSAPPALGFKTSGAIGVFNRAEWTIYVNENGDDGKLKGKKVKDLTSAELSDAADTIYHEARHSEQFFRVARVLAGHGAEAADIRSEMLIPVEVAALAEGRPLKRTPETSALVKEATDWHDITVGAHREYKEAIQALSTPRRRCSVTRSRWRRPTRPPTLRGPETTPSLT